MIRCTTFAGRKVAIFGLARTRALRRGRRWRRAAPRWSCWDDGEAGRAAAQKAGLPVARSGYSRLAAVCGTGAGAGGAADAPRAALDGAQGKRCRDRDHRRHRAVLPRTGEGGAGQSRGGDDRDERQVDHDRAHRPYPAGRGAGCADGRQHRHGDPAAGAAGARAVACHRDVVVPDRPDAVAGADGWRAAQHLAGSSGPPRDAGTLRGGQGAPG